MSILVFCAFTIRVSKGQHLTLLGKELIYAFSCSEHGGLELLLELMIFQGVTTNDVIVNIDPIILLVCSFFNNFLLLFIILKFQIHFLIQKYAHFLKQLSLLLLQIISDLIPNSQQLILALLFRLLLLLSFEYAFDLIRYDVWLWLCLLRCLILALVGMIIYPGSSHGQITSLPPI